IGGILRNGIPGPPERSRPRIVGPHLAAGRGWTTVVPDGRAGDYQTVHYQWWRAHGVGPGLEGTNPESALQVDHTPLAKVPARMTARGIERVQLRLRVGDENSARARRSLPRLGIQPGGHAAAGKVAVLDVAFDVRIE